MTENEKQKERIAYWLDLAQYDFDTAEAMLKTGRLLYVGFMCHQVVEKALKACYIKRRNETPPYSHNLSVLAKESGLLEYFTEDQKKYISLIQPMNVESRYPSYKGKIFQTLDGNRCEEILKQTKEFFLWLQSR
jgi:HEPN domain-containing protein